MTLPNDKKSTHDVVIEDGVKPSPTESMHLHGTPELMQTGKNGAVSHGEIERPVEEIEENAKGRFAYFKTRNFYVVLVMGFVIPDLMHSFPYPYHDMQ